MFCIRTLISCPNQGWSLNFFEQKQPIKSQGYLTVFDGGRLGNKMTQYATLLAHASRLGAKAVISKVMKDELSKHFPNLGYQFISVHERSFLIFLSSYKFFVFTCEFCLSFNLSIATKIWWILWPGAIRLKFADLSIICVWTYKKLPRIIQYSPNSNTCILGEYVDRVPYFHQ